jgi:hypothetical protein
LPNSTGGDYGTLYGKIRMAHFRRIRVFKQSRNYALCMARDKWAGVYLLRPVTNNTGGNYGTLYGKMRTTYFRRIRVFVVSRNYALCMARDKWHGPWLCK